MKKEEKKYGLFKGIFLLILIAIVLTWLIPNGSYETGAYVGTGALTRVGINDLAWLIYYGIWFSVDKIILLLVIGGMYGILSKTNAYDRLVTGIANKITHKKLAVVILSVIIALLTSILTQTFVVIIFIPFIISILNRMKLDKITIFATTFGSMLVGILGATYGTEGLYYLNGYLANDNTTINTTVLIRAGILLIGLVLFNFFTLNHMKKVENKEETSDMFIVGPVEKEGKSKKQSTLPIIILGIITLIITILGFINWNGNFGITAFDKFHETLSNIAIGDFHIFTSILGTNMKALGAWEDLFTIIAVIMVFTVIFAICYRVKFEEFLRNYAHGMKVMLKPIACVIAAFVLMVVVYMSPYLATIVNKLLSITDGFNLATMTLSTFLANIFHTDLGYTGYVFGSFLTTEYVDYINPIYVMLTSLYGFVQFFIPTSAVLGVGLTALGIKYKEWLKYIWRFLVGMIICLLIIFILMAVI